MKNESNETKQAERALKAISSKQEIDTVKYKDINGKQKSIKVTLTDPGKLYGLRAIDLLNTGNDSSDYLAIYNLIMDHVISNPKLSFAREEKKLPKSLKTKDIHVKNADGKPITLHFKFPGYETAVNMVSVSLKPSGASNLVGMLKSLDDNVIKDEAGRNVSEEYWNAGHTGNGLTLKAITEANNYLANVLDYDGFASMVQKGISFLMGKVRPN